MYFRIVKKPRGYIVEKQISYWSLFGLRRKWITYIKSAGLDCAWHHSTYEFAMKSLLMEVEMETYKYERKRNTI